MACLPPSAFCRSRLATHKIPIFHIVGEADRLLPYDRQMDMYRRYTALGGKMQIIGKKGVPHGLLPELLEDMGMYDFFMKQAGRSAP